MALAAGLGVPTPTAYKPGELMPRIMACFGRRKINLLFVDEGHCLWPPDARTEPKRIEFLRDLWEVLGVSVLILATPQYSAALAESLEDNPRWSPSQWIGRTMPFDLPETMTTEDFAAVARHHAPDAGPDAIDQLVLHAQASEGFCGAMVLLIQRARFRGAGGPLTFEAINAAQVLMDREARLAGLAGSKIIPITGRQTCRRASNRRPRGETG